MLKRCLYNEERYLDESFISIEIERTGAGKSIDLLIKSINEGVINYTHSCSFKLKFNSSLS